MPVEERETSQDIDRIATEWVVRMDRATLSACEADELKQWLAGDRRRRGAFMRAKAIWLRSESARALGPQYDPKDFEPAEDVSPPPPRVEPRSRFMRWSGALAASLIVALMLTITLQTPTAYATAKGEMRTVPLGDGTTVTLNTDTRIKIYDDEGQRRIRVVRGEVLIEGTGASVPTVVDIDDKHLQASSATFVVRKLEGHPAQILVKGGRVVLAEATRSTTIPLTPNLERELAWREGKIALQGETLAEAAAAYARYINTPIVIADANLARMQVTGLFAVNNPLGFSRAVAEVFDAEVHQEDGRIVISRSP